jgi:cytochrome c biogenesis protein CcmG, thiol:disulfide interchange protein DsbE
MNKRVLGFLLAVFVACPVHAGVADFLNGVKVGQPLPAHDIQFLGASPDTTDKLLLIDFWATHCAPCVTSIPEVNALHDKFAPKGLVIIGLSDEAEAKVKPFLAKHPMRYASAIEGPKSLQKALRIKAIPYAIFVDRKGKIVWRGQPDDITDELVESLLRADAKLSLAK